MHGPDGPGGQRQHVCRAATRGPAAMQCVAVRLLRYHHLRAAGKVSSLTLSTGPPLASDCFVLRVRHYLAARTAHVVWSEEPFTLHVG